MEIIWFIGIVGFMLFLTNGWFYALVFPLICALTFMPMEYETTMVIGAGLLFLVFFRWACYLHLAKGNMFWAVVLYIISASYLIGTMNFINSFGCNGLFYIAALAMPLYFFLYQERVGGGYRRGSSYDYYSDFENSGSDDRYSSLDRYRDGAAKYGGRDVNSDGMVDYDKIDEANREYDSLDSSGRD